MRPRRVACLAALAVAAAGCGGQTGTTSQSTAQWRANAMGALSQLRHDVSLTSIGSGSLGDANRALHDDSDLYALLVVYTDLGGCSHIMSELGAPARIGRILARACPGLERAAASFSFATQSGDAAALLRAARQAHRAEPLLVAALVAVRKA
jgi:hypothetical protein